MKTFLATICLLAAHLAPPVFAADVPAVVDWSQRVELGTRVSGVVTEVLVRPGQSVRKGDPMLALDKRGFATQVSRRVAEHRHAKSRLIEAQREDERAQELYDRTVLSDFDRNQATVALQAEQAATERARAALVEARLDLEHSVVRAPFDGIVLAVNAAPGQSVISELQSQPLVTVADDRHLRARGQVDAAQAAQLQPDMPLSATLRGQTLQAKVIYVGYEPVAQSGQGPRYELVADVQQDDTRKLRIGETVILHLE